MNKDDRGITEAGKPRSLTTRLIGEFRLFMVLFLYLWVLFGLFVLNQDIAQREHGDSIALQGFAILNALVLGKIMLVAEHLDFARWLRRKPAILSILFEAAFCSALFLGFHVIERSITILVRGTAASESPFSFGGGGPLGLAIVVVILFVSLLPFFAFKNVMRVIGEERMRRILFDGPEHRE
ncbi:hypothetical protein C3941_17710 [Kaistia algarum]|uniref:hypothetical protein n=1 Tax=Kaistia algarum TaxID=2083279 RepID=UPI000CE844D7|nr:hypothetical protein [Kaistia algarum]MCX5516714.1 hypothetical protein [Kaistia algarum]PPE78606.1 hypothetical protein C3941_17710 [Kaistia algarum]